MSTPEPIKILMVDDQPAKLLSYEVILSELGHELIKATSAREALGHLLKNDIAVILIDVQMPELDGFELAAMIREHPRYQQTPLIFVSAIALSDMDRIKGYEAGAVDYVPVPVVPQVLRAKVRVFADLHRKTRELERLNNELEQRVEERTAALEASHGALQALNEELESKVEARTREREQALAQLFEAQKVDTIGQLTGGVAHDFNNLLMAMQGSLQILKKRLKDDGNCQRLIDNALKGAERGAALTQRLLAFARRQELRPASVDIAQMVEGMQDLLARTLNPGVRMVADVPVNLRPVLIDQNQLELALLNLAVNASDAMPNGGLLSITASEVLCPCEDEAPSLRDGAYVRLSVSDTGMGMDEVTLARATEPFFTTKGIGKGTGLGLSMVHGLAAQSGGALRVCSRVGQGTTIELWLPQATLAEAAQAASEPRQEVEVVGSEPCTVLLVDDDALVSVGATAMLEDLGHTVLRASSAADALELLARGHKVDLVLTDHAMPDMTGLELAKKLRRERAGLPVLLASGYADVLAGEIMADLPRLAKPFLQDELARAISSILSRAPSAQAVAVGG